MVHDEQVTEEIIQDVFVRLWEKRVLLAGIQYPTSYLYNIDSNSALNYLKREKNHARILQSYARANSELSNETEDFVSVKERGEIITKAIAALPEQRRIIFELSRKDGLTNEQIAERLHLSIQTSRDDGRGARNGNIEFQRGILEYFDVNIVLYLANLVFPRLSTFIQFC